MNLYGTTPLPAGYRRSNIGFYILVVFALSSCWPFDVSAGQMPTGLPSGARIRSGSQPGLQVLEHCLGVLHGREVEGEYPSGMAHDDVQRDVVV